MNKLRNLTVSIATTAALVGGPSHAEAAQPTAPIEQEPSAASMQHVGRTATCDALNELRVRLGTSSAKPLFLFGDEHGMYGELAFLPDELRADAEKVQSSLAGPNTFADLRLSVESIGAVAASHVAAEAADGILDQFALYPGDILAANQHIDQSGAEAFIIEARAATNDAITHNC